MQETTTAGPGRVVAIVGRPNVGKSALFNRIAGRRIAIVFDQPGVTRDRVAREVEANGQRFLLVDTGGLAFDRTPGSEDPLAAETRQQAAVAVSDAAVRRRTAYLFPTPRATMQRAGFPLCARQLTALR